MRRSIPMTRPATDPAMRKRRRRIMIARIRQRSQGRFFGQRRWIDRMPYELLSIVMLAAIVAIYVWLQLSQPGLAPK